MYATLTYTLHSISFTVELAVELTLSLDSSDKMVVSGNFPSNKTEIKVFDPSNPSQVLSYDKTICESTTEGFSGQRCSQLFNAPKDMGSLYVLVVSLDPAGDVAGSTLKTYTCKS